MQGKDRDEDDDISYLEKLRYHKIILMADADVDGSHIRSLILTFFYKYLSLLIKNGHVYVALPPLYGIRISGKMHYIKDEENFKKFLANKFYTDYIFEVIENNKILEINDLIHLVEICEDYKNKIQPLWKGDIDFNIYSYLIILLLKETNFNNIKKQFEDLYPQMTLIDEVDHYFIKEITVYGVNNYIINKKLPELNTTILQTIPLKIIPKKNLKLKCQIYTNPLDVLNYINSIITKLDIQRFKGLGEMNADQLEETAINPKSRHIVQISLKDEDIYATSNIVNDLMTHEGVNSRKQLILEGINKNLMIDV